MVPQSEIRFKKEFIIFEILYDLAREAELKLMWKHRYQHVV